MIPFNIAQVHNLIVHNLIGTRGEGGEEVVDEEGKKMRAPSKSVFIQSCCYIEDSKPQRFGMPIAQVKDGNSHPTKCRDPLVPLDLVVDEAVDLVVSVVHPVASSPYAHREHTVAGR